MIILFEYCIHFQLSLFQRKSMTVLKSEGKCLYCEKMFAAAGIGRHLTSHLKNIQKESISKRKAYHLKIPANGMFLHLLVSDETELGDLDLFLREIWLECCGHLSSFRVKNKQYEWSDDEFGENLGQKVSDIFYKGLKLKYEYDFGSTTQLEIQVLNEYHINVFGGILLLSRNEPLPILCHLCNKKPAAEICSIHIYEDACMFCKSCAKKHEKECPDFEDYASMPLYNSPRMGVCAYEGGIIDKERDGVWKG